MADEARRLPGQGSLIGDGLLADRFRVRQQLGSGAFGHVFLAWDRLHERDVALKILELGGLEREACLHEARALARVRHPNVVTVYELVHQVDPPYLVMEYVEGEEVERLLERRGEPLEPARAAAVARSVTAALVAAHQAGVLHRDVKTGNVIVGEDGRVTLIDFGVALRARGPDGRDTAEGDRGVVGTPSYLAPEVLLGGDHDERGDLYAVGVLLYRMLSLRHPFEARSLAELRARHVAADALPDLREHRPEVPVPLAEVVRRCLAPREERYASAEALLRALDQLGQLGTRPLPPRPYVGLAPFTAEERGVFFGREEEVARIIGRLQTTPVLALVGASGAGKSSLALAGVAPAVASGSLETAGSWRAVRLAPGPQPLRALAAALATVCGGEPDEIHTALVASPERWWRRVVSRPRRRGAGVDCLLLLVDQLEELVTLCDDEEARRQFAQVLRGAGAAGPQVRVVTTVRDDFLARLGAVEGLSEVLGAIHIVRPLDGEALRAAVVEPARAFGFTFEADTMVERIVQELAGRSGSLPLLQFGLGQLWEQRDEARRVLPRASLDRMGSIGRALAHAADAVVEQLARQGLAAETRRVLLELLTPEGTKRSRSLEEILEAADGAAAREGARAVVQRLREARLLCGSDAALELTHEALVSEWSLLRRWIEESRARRELAADAEHVARRWVDRDRAADLLWRGQQLVEARSLLAGSETTSLTREAAAFVEASLRNARRMRLRRWLVALAALCGVAVAGGLYIRGLALERDLARRQAQAEREALENQRRITRVERERTKAEEERRRLLEAWVKERRQLIADLNKAEDSALRRHILRRLTGEVGSPTPPKPAPAAGPRPEVCLFGPAKDLSMKGDWWRTTAPAAEMLAKSGYEVGCQYPYVRTAFRSAVAHGLLQHGGNLAPATLERLLTVLRQRFPRIEVRQVPPRRLFRAVDVLLPE